MWNIEGSDLVLHLKQGIHVINGRCQILQFRADANSRVTYRWPTVQIHYNTGQGPLQPQRHLYRIQRLQKNEVLSYFWKVDHRDVRQECTASITARSPKVWTPLINSHSFMQTLTNQKSRTVSSWLLIGLNFYEGMWIIQKRSHFWAPCCNCLKFFRVFRSEGKQWRIQKENQGNHDLT